MFSRRNSNPLRLVQVREPVLAVRCWLSGDGEPVMESR
jgi:hypothetical protein